MVNQLFITGAGVSAESGIPTFRGDDGFWRIGSINYTPQEMATRQMYIEKPAEFLLWYFKRFAEYRHIKPNKVHQWLSNKKLITQNIDGLDGKAGNESYIPIHGRLDKVTVFGHQEKHLELMSAPWDQLHDEVGSGCSEAVMKDLLLDAFRISKATLRPEKDVSLKPFVLLFDEYYTDMYRMSDALERLHRADVMIFMGTSFSVGITSIALEIALKNNADVHIVDPEPIDLGLNNARYHTMKAIEFIELAATLGV
jgi:NAD-dependent deacetylase